jgi:hypothetical protein
LPADAREAIGSALAAEGHESVSSLEPSAVVPPPAPVSVPLATYRYVAPPERIRQAYAVAVAAGVLAFVTSLPALGELASPPAPGWVWILIPFVLVQAGYAFWLANLPDWSTVWVGMALFVVLAAIDASGLAIVLATPVDRSLPWGLDEVRASAATWCAAKLALDGGLASAAGWISSRWRREYVEAKTAARRPRR